jgi:hypothetical protein
MFFSLLPILAAAIGFYWSDKNLGSFGSIEKVVGKGELILFASTLMAPVLYSTQKEKPVSYKDAFFLVAISLVMIGVIFSVVYSLGFINREMFFVSLSIAALAVILLYWNMFALRKADQPVHKLEQAQNSEFRENARRLREEQK